MKKVLSLFLVIIFLTSMTYPAFAADHREIVMSYLTEKYGVTEEKIELYEGGITELEFTAESFWMASYAIFAEGKPASGDFKGGKMSPEPMPLPAPEIMPMPAPDIPSAGIADIMPAEPRDAAGRGNIYGGIYIHLKTGEVLEQDKMEAYFLAESQLAQQEWERLRKEAGKLDVPLYRKLKGLTAAEKASVSIHPTPVETDELKTQFEALKKKYPEYTSDMDLKNILPYAQAYDLPYIGGGGAASSSGSSGIAAPGDAAVSYIVPDNPEKPTMPLEETDVRILPVAPDEKYWQEYSAVWEEVEKIRLKAAAPSLTVIKEELNSMKVSYKDNGSYITADLTAEQINNIANLSAVSQVFEEMIFVALDAREDMLARSSAPNMMMAASAEAKRDGNSSSYLLPLSLAAALLTVALVIYNRRIRRNS